MLPWVLPRNLRLALVCFASPCLLHRQDLMCHCPSILTLKRLTLIQSAHLSNVILLPTCLACRHRVIATAQTAQVTFACPSVDGNGHPISWVSKCLTPKVRRATTEAKHHLICLRLLLPNTQIHPQVQTASSRDFAHNHSPLCPPHSRHCVGASIQDMSRAKF